MAIQTSFGIIQVAPDVYIPSSYFIVRGTVENKRVFILSIACYKSKDSNESTKDVVIKELALSVSDPLFINTIHNEAMDYLKDLNSDIDFSIVDL